MTEIDGGPAFPNWASGDYMIKGGMSLRDYFAAQALNGLLADHRLSAAETEDFVKLAYKYADAMLKARQE